MSAPATAEFREPARASYEHLAPVLSEYAALSSTDPQRRRLRAELILAFRPVARNIARRYTRRHGEPAEDIEQVACLALVLAVDRFDPARGVDFLSFAVPTITGEILRYFRDRTMPIRLPRSLRTVQHSVRDAAAELAQRHGHAARPSEIAEHLGVDMDLVLQALAAEGAGHPFSLDEPSQRSERPDTMGKFDAALVHVEPQYDLVEQRLGLAPLLAALPEREHRILVLRFVNGLTQTEIGHQVGISQMHVSRILSRTIALLRRELSTS